MTVVHGGELKKQVNFPISTWAHRALEWKAAKEKTKMSRLLLAVIEPYLEEVMKEYEDSKAE